MSALKEVYPAELRGLTIITPGVTGGKWTTLGQEPRSG